MEGLCGTLRLHHNMSVTDKTDNLMLPMQEPVVGLSHTVRRVPAPDVHGYLRPVKAGYVPVLQDLTHEAVIHPGNVPAKPVILMDGLLNLGLHNGLAIGNLSSNGRLVGNSRAPRHPGDLGGNVGGLGFQLGNAALFGLNLAVEIVELGKLCFGHWRPHFFPVDFAADTIIRSRTTTAHTPIAIFQEKTSPKAKQKIQ